MANGSSLQAAQLRSNLLHSTARLSTPKAFRVSVGDTFRGMALDCSHQEAFSALQKYKVKRLDLFFVTLTNSFLGERVGKRENKNSNSNFS
jgi:hypothetical protein